MQLYCLCRGVVVLLVPWLFYFCDGVVRLGNLPMQSIVCMPIVVGFLIVWSYWCFTCACVEATSQPCVLPVRQEFVVSVPRGATSQSCVLLVRQEFVVGVLRCCDCYLLVVWVVRLCNLLMRVDGCFV